MRVILFLLIGLAIASSAYAEDVCLTNAANPVLVLTDLQTGTLEYSIKNIGSIVLANENAK